MVAGKGVCIEKKSCILYVAPQECRANHMDLEAKNMERATSNAQQTRAIAHTCLVARRLWLSFPTGGYTFYQDRPQDSPKKLPKVLPIMLCDCDGNRKNGPQDSLGKIAESSAYRNTFCVQRYDTRKYGTQDSPGKIAESFVLAEKYNFLLTQHQKKLPRALLYRGAPR